LVLLPLALFTFHFPPERSVVSASGWLRWRPPAYFSSVSQLGVEFAAFLLVLLLGLGGEICFLFVSVSVFLELRSICFLFLEICFLYFKICFLDFEICFLS
jgi:hypothetical protein